MSSCRLRGVKQLDETRRWPDLSNSGASSSLIPQQIKAKLAIQQHDRHHDAIVVTTLSQYPFHCHEELLAMSGSQLRGVAAQLNARLPLNSRLPASNSTSSAHLRADIEKLVGIVQEDDGVRSQLPISQPSALSEKRMPSPPSSPLAKHVSRKRRFQVPAPAPLLESVEEEDEVIPTRSSKRRRVSEETCLEALTNSKTTNRTTQGNVPQKALRQAR